MPFSAACLKIVACGDPRAARDSDFSERDCREEHHCNKSGTKRNIITIFHTDMCSDALLLEGIVTEPKLIA
jgi:hypothetical protein